MDPLRSRFRSALASSASLRNASITIMIVLHALMRGTDKHDDREQGRDMGGGGGGGGQGVVGTTHR